LDRLCYTCMYNIIRIKGSTSTIGYILYTQPIILYNCVIGL